MNFDMEVAEKVGTDCAIILSNIEFWQYHNQVNDKNFHNGKYWTYNSINAWLKLFPYLTESKLRRCLDKLESFGYISTGNFNKSSYDRTKWYCSNRQIDLSISSNGFVKNDETIPNNKQHIINQINKTHISATEILKQSKPTEFQTFEMQNKKQVNDWDKMLDSFNDKVIIEVANKSLTLEPNSLLARLRTYTRSWITNNTNEVKKEILPPTHRSNFVL